MRGPSHLAWTDLPGNTSLDMGTKIYVGNLPYSCDEGQLRALFSADGRQVEDVAIVTDRVTGQPRGFAFVQMATDDDAKRAIEALHGSSFGGRTLTVNEAKPREGGGGGARGGRP
jgi:RNA recognition motif-containing protein